MCVEKEAREVESRVLVHRCMGSGLSVGAAARYVPCTVAAVGMLAIESTYTYVTALQRLCAAGRGAS